MAGGGKPPKVSAPSVMKRSGISELAEYIKNREGSYGERRVQRAADEIPRLGELYSQDALRSAFSGDNARALMTLKPSEFENYAAPLFTNLSKESKDNIANLKTIQSVGGFSDVPFFLVNKELAGSTGLPWVTGHEGRHRNRAMDAAGEQAGLVRFEPRAELREPFPRKYQEEYIDAIRKEMALSGNKIKPEKYYLQETDEKTFQRPAIDLPDLYANGGAVNMDKGGITPRAFSSLPTDDDERNLRLGLPAELNRLGQLDPTIQSYGAGLSIPVGNARLTADALASRNAQMRDTLIGILLGAELPVGEGKLRAEMMRPLMQGAKPQYGLRYSKPFADGGAVHMQDGGDPQAEIDRMRLELSRRIKPTTDVNEQIANAQRMASPERLSLDAGDAITSPEMYEQNRDLFTVNRKPASQAYTEFGVPMIDAAGKSVPFPKTMRDIEVDKVEKQLESGIKPSWMSDRDFIEDQSARKGYVTSPKTAGDFGQNAMAALMGSKFLGGTLRALGDVDEAAQAVIGSSYGLDPTIGLVGQTGRLHRVPRGLSTIKEGIVRDVGQFPNDFFNAQRGITQGYPTLGSVTGDVVGKVAPIASKIDDAVRLGYESGRVPQLGMSIKDVTPRVSAPANEMGFYSATEKAALNLQRKSGSGQAFLNDILKQENVRPDEINAMGLDTFLKGKNDVTAAEVQDYIASNKIQLGEARYQNQPKLNTEQTTRLNDLQRTDFDRVSPDEFERRNGAGSYEELLQLQNNRDGFNKERLQYEAGRMANEARKYQTLGTVNGDNLSAQYRAKADHLLRRAELASDESRQPKFSGHQLPGGENYREVVITLPSNRPSLKNMSRSEYNDAVDAADKSGVNDYQSSHFDEPNILAHLRMSDRVTDGKKTLLVDEVQSDWHQAGRESGYNKKYTPEELTKISELRQKIDDQSISYAEMTELTDLQNKNWQTVPDAPFKEDWYQLALKRAVKEAIDGGYDRVALPTGARVAERFDLSKQIESISHQKNPNGTYKIVAVDKNNRHAMNEESVPQDKLSSIVGKDVAQKIINAEGTPFPEGTVGAGMSKLSGLDLQVGGDGMKKYYDEIYPGYLKKFGKKYGSTVGKTTVDVDGTPEPLHYMEITPAMREEFKAGIHMKRGGKVQFANNIDAMRLALSKG